MSPLLLATVEPHRLLDSPTFAIHFGRVAVARGLLPDGVSVEEGLAANGWRITDEPSVRVDVTLCYPVEAITPGDERRCER